MDAATAACIGARPNGLYSWLCSLQFASTGRLEDVLLSRHMTVRSPEQWRPPAGISFVERLSVLSFLQHSEVLTVP